MCLALRFALFICVNMNIKEGCFVYNGVCMCMWFIDVGEPQELACNISMLNNYLTDGL